MPSSESISGSAETVAHCRRVAHLCEQTARRLNIEGPINLGLIVAALSHQDPCAQRKFGKPNASLEAVAADLALAILESRPGVSPEVDTAMSILQLCDEFDEAVEFSAYESEAISGAVEAFFEEAGTRYPGGIVDALRNAVLARARVAFDGSLPVLPSAAAKLMATSADTLSAIEFESIAASDPVLAGCLLKTANSAAFGSQSQIGRLGPAILRLGVPFARKVLLAESFRGVFASRSLAKLWTRSRNVAAAAHELAGECGYDQDVAFVSGLLHDIGKLLIERCPAEARVKEEESIAAGFPATYAEILTYGQDHAALGGELLRRWNLPGEIADAVEFHHRPEASGTTLASILYLAAQECEGAPLSADNLSAGMRHATALKRTGASATRAPLDRSAPIFAMAC